MPYGTYIHDDDDDHWVSESLRDWKPDVVRMESIARMQKMKDAAGGPTAAAAGLKTAAMDAKHPLVLGGNAYPRSDEPFGGQVRPAERRLHRSAEFDRSWVPRSSFWLRPAQENTGRQQKYSVGGTRALRRAS